MFYINEGELPDAPVVSLLKLPFLV